MIGGDLSQNRKRMETNIILEILKYIVYTLVTLVCTASLTGLLISIAFLIMELIKAFKKDNNGGI